MSNASFTQSPVSNREPGFFLHTVGERKHAEIIASEMANTMKIDAHIYLTPAGQYQVTNDRCHAHPDALLLITVSTHWKEWQHA